MVGYRVFLSAPFLLTAGLPAHRVGTIVLRQDAVKLGQVTVSSDRPAINLSIDRKVYDVQQDLLSKSGSVSDLLQNIPSVQVDVDGTVSLRGSPNVQILINGKNSPMVASGGAEVLQDIPASSVERVEVITNPSAKFKPEGTSGLINIVLKKEAELGLNGSLGANLGNSSRYNITANGNYHPGQLNLFGSYSFRQDERNIWSSDARTQLDSATNSLSNYVQSGHAYSRPYTHFATLGMDFTPNEGDKFGVSGNLRVRKYTSTDTTSYHLTDNTGLVTSSYDRRRVDYDETPVVSGTGFFEHDFLKEDHTLRLELTGSHLFDQEDNHFTDLYRVPPGLITYDNRRINEYNDEGEATIDYHNKLTERSVFEAGYDGTFGRDDFPFTANYFDTTANALVNDTSLTNHFLYRGTVHALYGTYENTLGAFSMMAGLRTEYARITSDLLTSGSSFVTEYWKLYPTVHLAYRLNDLDELQLNYSLRVNRPEPEDLNPFPEYQNPRNLRAGNPRLQPEFVNSVEFGCQIQYEQATITPSVFYRNRFNGFTLVTVPLNDSTLLTTHENLSSDVSGGAELVVTGDFGSFASINLSGSAYYEEIDASNLGYAGKKSATSWNGNLNCNFHVTRGTMLQVNANYRSSRLTPQGTVHPSYAVNLGARHDLIRETLTLTATISDMFNTLSRKTDVQTSWLNENLAFARDARVFFVGLTYHFGNYQKKGKDEGSLQYDQGN